MKNFAAKFGVKRCRVVVVKMFCWIKSVSICKTSFISASPGNCEEKWFPTSLNEQRNSSFWNINAFTCTQISKHYREYSPMIFHTCTFYLSCVSPFFKYDNMQPPLWSPFQNFASTFPISQSYDRQTKNVYGLKGLKLMEVHAAST